MKSPFANVRASLAGPLVLLAVGVAVTMTPRAGRTLTAAQPPQGAAQPTPPAAPAGQQPPAGQAPGRGQQPGARGQGGGRGPAVPPLAFTDRTGFESTFNGTSLTPGEQQQIAAQQAAQKAAAEQPEGARGRGRGTGGTPISRFQDWDGDPKFWRAENGVIIGESTPEKVVNPNTFLIWRGGAPGDFELKAEVKMSAENSGIQYRSRMIPLDQGLQGKPGHAWRLAGYQMDMDFNNQYPGHLYEEAGRGFLTDRGTVSYIGPDGAKGMIGSLKTVDELKASFKPGDWNQFHLIAHGNAIVHIVNGLVTAVCIDDDLKGRAMAGLIGFQLHTGGPMKLEIRNVAIKLR